MMFLLPIGGITDSRFGIMTHPGHRGIPLGIKSGLVWGADNQAFSKKFKAQEHFEWLMTVKQYQLTCLFCAVPDCVGDHETTLDLWHVWKPLFQDWPIAFVCQDGCTPKDIPCDCNAVFIGGTTAWKISEAAIDCIRWGQENSKHIHIGRVNYQKRYNYFSSIKGSEEFTCDGTRTRWDLTATIPAWIDYMANRKVLQIW